MDINIGLHFNQKRCNDMARSSSRSGSLLHIFTGGKRSDQSEQHKLKTNKTNSEWQQLKQFTARGQLVYFQCQLLCEHAVQHNWISFQTLSDQMGNCKYKKQKNPSPFYSPHLSLKQHLSCVLFRYAAFFQDSYLYI